MLSEPLTVHHDVTAMFAAWVLAVYGIQILSLVLRRIRGAEAELAWVWWVAGAVAVGTGLWAQSFVSLLGRQLPPNVGYHPEIILGSWVPAVLMVAVIITSLRKVKASRGLRMSMASVAGLSLGLMSYLNVRSMDLHPGVAWDLEFLAAGIAVTGVGCVCTSVLLRRQLLREGQPVQQLLVSGVVGSSLYLGQMMMIDAAEIAPHAVSVNPALWTGARLEFLAVGGALLLFLMMHLGMVLEAQFRRRQAQLQSHLEEARHELEAAAHRDVLTGLLNRNGFEAYLRDVLAIGPQRGLLAVMRINLDGFRALVDTYGHGVGDALLQQVAQRLLVLVRTSDAPARAEGEEYLLLLRDMPDQYAVMQLAQRIRAAVGLPCEVRGEELSVTCSVGIALYPQSGSPEDLLNHANEAMLTARKAGGSMCCLHEPGMDQTGARHVEMQRELRQAIQRNELMLHFQPKLDAHNGMMVGVEALLRWTHPTRGPISPGEFIPVAERFGLIGELGQWVLNEACWHMRIWLDMGMEIPVAVNVSAHQLREHDLEERVREALAKHNVPPSMLIMEITESVAMDDIESSLRVFDMLDRIGVKLSIDDFGTGYSSLSYLRRLPARQLKIDRSFVGDLGTSHDARAIVEAVVRLAHALGLKVVAEGVETEEQRQVLVELGCDELQGFLLGRPMAASGLRDWLRDQLAIMPYMTTEVEAAHVDL